MCNHPISNGKTMFDIFNMVNPNCYQAFIIQSIIECKKHEAIQYCDELMTAIEYYKWEVSSKHGSYIDSLICESNLEKWQKIAIIHIISNDVKSCKSVIEGEIEREKLVDYQRLESAKQYKEDPKKVLQSLYNMFGFNSLI